ncbi:hypothetical protein F383_24857 [Gossypium arboreum]|uniref:Uncharacterized protein n=1 Tax=Gossypium arboreum TaxID=29729 RepID=A0A0B0P776_GOSAR|nr:hypothetical protein F383_24857 [Gossypium arboreum]
MTLFCPQG